MAEAFLYGDSIQDYCVGVLVPNPDEIKKIAEELAINPNQSLRDLCAN